METLTEYERQEKMNSFFMAVYFTGSYLELRYPRCFTESSAQIDAQQLGLDLLDLGIHKEYDFRVVQRHWDCVSVYVNPRSWSKELWEAYLRKVEVKAKETGADLFGNWPTEPTKKEGFLLGRLFKSFFGSIASAP